MSEFNNKSRKAQISAFNEATGKLKKDPLVWRIQNQNNKRSKTNVKVNKYATVFNKEEEGPSSLYGTQTIIPENAYNN